jgi:hypothetical protein
VLAQQQRPRTPEQSSRHQGHQDGVVELPGNRDEVRDDVERQRKIGNEQSKRDLRTRRDPVILE